VADGTEVTNFKITNIVNGTLYKHDGTTAINSGDFITFAEGSAGLKFLPAADLYSPSTSFSFDVQASLTNDDSGIGGNTATATILVNPVADTPSITGATTNEDVQTSSGLVISRNPVDGGEVAYFKIVAITNGTLFQNNGTTPIAVGGFITYAEGQAGLKFTPALHFHGTASISVQASLTSDDSGVGGGQAAASIDVNPVAHTPSVTDATTDEDVQSASGLVISRNAIDDSSVTNFKITGITNGTLYKNDGNTLIHDGDFITYAEGHAGLKFTPSADYFGSGSFQVQASTSPSDAGLGGSTATATITVNSVNDAPTLDPIGNVQVNEDASQQTIGLTGITVGPANEAAAGQTIASVTATSDNHALVADPTVLFNQGNGTYTLEFTPILHANGTAHITVTVMDDGGTTNNGVDTTTKSFTLTVISEPDAPILDTFLIPMLPAVPLRTVPTGTPASTLLQNVTDYDLGDPRGMAITGVQELNGKKTIGQWQFSTDGGTLWTHITGVSATNALLLDGSNLVRFLPAKGYTGFASISYRAWDESDGLRPGFPTSIFSSTAYSTATERAWVAVGRTKPTIDANGNTVLPSMKEDAKNPVVIKATKFLGLAANEQVSSKGLGIAVVSATSADGVWQYKLAGTKNWVPVPIGVGGVSMTDALLLRPTDSLRFLPNLHAYGTEVIEFKTWDAKNGTAGQLVNPTGTDFSVDGGSAALTIIHVNHAPSLTLPVSAPTLPGITAGQTTVAATLGNILNASDVDGDTIGVAITSAKGAGTWQYSTDGGNTWQPVTASASHPLRLAEDTMVKFTANASTKKSTATLSFKAWDGTVDSKGKALPTSVSKVTETLSVAVN
jgi:hypothetical protein